VTALLASERCQLRMRTKPRLTAMELHDSAARFATRRHQLDVLHVVAVQNAAALSCSMPIHAGGLEHGFHAFARVEHACLHGTLGYSNDLGDLFD
jgi:hypothetical protein